MFFVWVFVFLGGGFVCSLITSILILLFIPITKAQLPLPLLHSPVWGKKQNKNKKTTLFMYCGRPLGTIWNWNAFVSNKHRVCFDGSRKQKRQGEIWLHLEYVVLSSYIQPGNFLSAGLSLVQRLITTTDECPGLLVANWEINWEGQMEGEIRGLIPALWYVSDSGYLWAAMLSTSSTE